MAQSDGKKDVTEVKRVKKQKKNMVEVKRVKKQEQAPLDTNITPLKLTCEIELGPATLATIAKHVEALFLKKMMEHLEPNN
jgi:hypothetical protein